jgi:oligoendopeptidase F
MGPHLTPTTETDGSAGTALSRREEIDPAHRWDLTALFPDDDAWNTEFARVEARTREAEGYRGTLGTSGASLLAWLRFADELSERTGIVMNYAFRRFDEDTASTPGQAMMRRAVALESAFAAATSWVVPELLAVPSDTIAGYLRDTPGLDVYRHALDDVLRRAPHTRSPEIEHELARAQEALSAAGTIFDMFNDADLRFATIRGEDGEDVEVTKGRYLVLQESTDRRVRQDAYRALYGAYAKFRHTLAATYAAHVQRDAFYARARNFPSARAMALFDANVPVDVYDALVASVNARLVPLHRAMELRRRALGLDILKPWDLFVPLAPDAQDRYPFDTARDVVLRGLAPLGDSYTAALREATAGRWIDVHETAGKTSGAYSAWTYGAHPFILLNHRDTLKDVFTLAHELGHAMHALHTWRAQPPVYGGYAIFTAETASTFNELLLADRLLAETSDRRTTLALLLHLLESIRGTVYNQVLFAEFEQRAHERAWNGEPLTAERLCDDIGALYARYYGPAFDVDELFRYNWSRVPHFYRSFYVYQYATGMSAAIALSRAVLDGRKGARDRYLAFLRAGSSKYPIELLRDAGVDMTGAQPVEAAAALMDDLVSRAEALL